MATTVIPLAGGGGGGSISSDDDVRFFDPYDGSLVATYSAADFANLSALPDNPTHDGLTSQGWNWALADAKEQVAYSGYLDIGQHYATTDGATRVYVRMNSLFAVRVRLQVNGSVSVDWGDNTTPSTLTGTNYTSLPTEHTYSAVGDYVVKIKALSGDYKIFGSSSGNGSFIFTTDQSLSYAYVALGCVRRIEVGADASISDYAFSHLKSCESITVPIGASITGNNLLHASGVKTFSFPNGVTTLGDKVFESSVTGYVSLPKTISTIGTRFLYSSRYIRRLIIPKWTSSLGASTYNGAYSTERLFIPQGITSVPGTFAAYLDLSEITLPSNITSIGEGAFNSCNYLNSITFPSGLTSIGNTAFQYDYALTEIVFPASLTSIGNYAFGSCNSLTSIKFLGSTPPTVGSNAFSNLSTRCRIYVPSGSLSAYTSTSNMPSSSSYTYVEY